MLYGSICGNVVTHCLSCCDSQIHDLNTAAGIRASRDITLRPLDMGGGIFVWRPKMGAEAHQHPILYVQPPLNVRLYWNTHLTSMSPLYVHPISLCCFLHLIPVSITSRLIYKFHYFFCYFFSPVYCCPTFAPNSFLYLLPYILVQMFLIISAFFENGVMVECISYKVKTEPGSAYIKALVETRPNPVSSFGLCMQRSLLIIHVVT